MAVQQTETSVNLGLAVQPETTDPKVFQEAYRLYNAVKALASALDFYTGALIPPTETWEFLSFTSTVRHQNIGAIYILAGEEIANGAVVNLYNDAGVLKARNANATDDTKPVRAFTQNGAVASGERGQFILPIGIHSAFSGLTPAAEYWLSTSDGQLSVSAPAVPGNIKQKVGFALSETELYFYPSLDWELV